MVHYAEWNIGRVHRLGFVEFCYTMSWLLLNNEYVSCCRRFFYCLKQASGHYPHESITLLHYE